MPLSRPRIPETRRGFRIKNAIGFREFLVGRWEAVISWRYGFPWKDRVGKIFSALRPYKKREYYEFFSHFLLAKKSRGERS